MGTTRELPGFAFAAPRRRGPWRKPLVEPAMSCPEPAVCAPRLNGLAMWLPPERRTLDIALRRQAPRQAGCSAASEAVAGPAGSAVQPAFACRCIFSTCSDDQG